MIAVEFFRLIWPTRGIYVIETGPHPVKGAPGRTTHWQRAFDNIEDAAAYCMKVCGEFTVYFAVHTFSCYRQEKTKDGRTWNKVARTQANAAYARALYMDLDVGPGADKYATQADALAGLIAFTKAVGLPRPLVVCSGRGLHVYWPFTEDVPSSEWQAVADLLKCVAAALGLKADAQITADAARVLRPVGTVNRKDPANPLRVALWGKAASPTPFSTLAGVLQRAGADLPASGLPTAAATASPGAAAPPPETPENVAAVRATLAALSPDIGRDDWRRVVWGVASLGWDCGEELAREWSARSAEKFDESAFATMWGSFDPSRAGGVTWRTLEHLAIAAGYVGPNLVGAVAPAVDGTTANRERLEDFVAFLPENKFIHRPTEARWPAASVDGRLPRVLVRGDDGGEPKPIRPSAWLTAHQAVAQVTWHPGEPELIRGRISREGELVSAPGSDCLNLYKPPLPRRDGDAGEAGRWLDLVSLVYPDDAGHLVAWMAHRVQRPGDKVNHAIVLGGVQGIGKDTILQPLVEAVGPWNVTEIAPAALLGQFNPYAKSVVLRISEVHDLGDQTRQQFYDRGKTLITAPPNSLRVNEKHRTEYHVKNCCGVVMTTNHKTDGVYLPADDRRHFVAWSTRSREDFPAGFWEDLQQWYAAGGFDHVAAYLRTYDLSGFNAKAPPRKTPAFWEIVDAGRAPEDAELAGVVDRLGTPPALTMKQLLDATAPPGEDVQLHEWLADRKNRRAIPHRLTQCGYTHVRNAAAKDGVWKVGGRGVPIYALERLSEADRQRAAVALTNAESAPRHPILRAVE